MNFDREGHKYSVHNREGVKENFPEEVSPELRSVRTFEFIPEKGCSMGSVSAALRGQCS